MGSLLGAPQVEDDKCSSCRPGGTEGDESERTSRLVANRRVSVVCHVGSLTSMGILGDGARLLE